MTPKIGGTSETSEDLKQNKSRPFMATFKHITDLPRISSALTQPDTLARFLRRKRWNVVCQLSELRVLPVFDAAEADNEGGICCQRKAASVRPR